MAKCHPVTLIFTGLSSAVHLLSLTSYRQPEYVKVLLDINKHDYNLKYKHIITQRLEDLTLTAHSQHPQATDNLRPPGPTLPLTGTSYEQ